MMLIQKGTVWQRLVETTERALRSGALLPIATSHAFIEEQGVRYFVRVLESLRRKDEARKSQEAATRSGKQMNPFLPPEPDLTVGAVTPTHIAVLNKFNVVPHHLLIVTREFEDQETLLTPRDFEALCHCMREYRSLGFYNGGRDAGASQQHKHLQLVPLPLAPDGPSVPVEPLLERAGPGHESAVVPGFPFLHCFARIPPIAGDPPERTAETLYRFYGGMLEQLGMAQPVSGRPVRQSQPYCLLVTSEWMLLVPRSREHFEDISLNSLAFAGSFFVRDTPQLERLRGYGVMRALAAVTLSAPQQP